jgi:hypothetical protein
MHPNADIGAIHRVAVLPFESTVQDRSVGEKVTRLFTTELLALGVFDVVEPGLVTRTLRTERIDSAEALTAPDFKRLGEALKADGFFLGSVVEFAETRSGSTPTPTVTIQLRLIEAPSGVTVWSVSQTRAGASASARLFGIGGESLVEAARDLMRQELKTLVR